jgi:hypothetical protein
MFGSIVECCIMMMAVPITQVRIQILPQLWRTLKYLTKEINNENFKTNYRRKL